MPKYYITNPRYVRQKGQGAPGYVDASERFPAVIELDEGAKLDHELFTLDVKGKLQPVKSAPKRWPDANQKS